MCTSTTPKRRNHLEESMSNRLLKTVVACAIATVGLAPVSSAQPPAPAPLAVANPTYITIPMEITVNRPAAEVWKRVGKYCDIGEWLRVQCTITSGTDGEIGAVRSIGPEILVGRTELS